MLRRTGTLFIIGLIIISLAGCVAVVAAGAGGAGTAAWLSGKMTQEVKASYDKTISASRSGLKALKLEIAKETKTDEVTQIRSNYTDGREIWIDIRPVTQNSTRIDIRVGVKGDREAADKILNKIVRYL